MCRCWQNTRVSIWATQTSNDGSSDRSSFTKTAWNDTLPQWCRQQALAERWQIVAGELPGHIVGPAEILCVMYGATMVAPLQHDAADLYLWASNQAVVAHFGPDSESAKGAYEVSKHVTDADVLQPGGRLYHDYRQLAFEIRDKVAKTCRERIKQEKKNAKRR